MRLKNFRKFVGDMARANDEDEGVEYRVSYLSWSGSASYKHRYTSAKRQNTCGSCWAFTTTGTLEEWAHIKTGQKPILSEQQVLDCSRGSNDCGRGWITGVCKSRGDTDMASILNSGPLGVAMDFRNINFRGYCDEVWTNTNCNQWLNHAITNHPCRIQQLLLGD
ncbi:hypothetical protein ACHWQZ_G007151 [Mnemiopsis leidyi]